MGRVYNALLKAERLHGPQRPIGRPDLDLVGDVIPDPIDVRPSQIDELPLTTAVRPASPHPALDARRANIFKGAAETRPEAVRNPQAARKHNSDLDRGPDRGNIRGRDPVHDLGSNLLSGPATGREPAPSARQVVEPRRIVNLESLRLAPHLAHLLKENTRSASRENTGGAGLALERYRVLAARLSSLAGQRKLKSILVTSAEPGEGKSTVAATVAWMLAQRRERRVLLLDANLRRTSVNRLLDVPPMRGWLDLGPDSEDPAVLSSALARIDPNGLYLMAARGARSEAEAERTAADPFANGAIEDALMSSRFERLLAALSEHFDLILIDAPAALEFAAASQLAALAGGCVIVARAGRTDYSRFSEAVDLVPHERRLGVVLNECESAARVARGREASLFSRLFRRRA